MQFPEIRTNWTADNHAKVGIHINDVWQYFDILEPGVKQSLLETMAYHFPHWYQLQHLYFLDVILHLLQEESSDLAKYFYVLKLQHEFDTCTPYPDLATEFGIIRYNPKKDGYDVYEYLDGDIWICEYTAPDRASAFGHFLMLIPEEQWTRAKVAAWLKEFKV